MSAAPPAWAEALLRSIVARGDQDAVSGDLLEAYRDSILPSRGPRGADWWYVGQVCGFVWRRTWLAGLIFGGAFVARTVLDWRVPTQDFLLRSQVSTLTGVSILLIVAMLAAWRSGSLAAGPIAGVATAALGAIVSITGAAIMLTLWHDPETLMAASMSGGLGEDFTLPIAMLLPGLVLGTIGGLIGAACRRVIDPRTA
jgi:hypothetical protein